MEKENLRATALQLAVLCLADTSPNADTVLRYADIFYGWLTQGCNTPLHTIDPQAEYGTR